MKYVLSVQETKAAEQAAVDHGLCEDVLIENAAAAMARAVQAIAADTVKIAGKTRKTRVLVVAGGGNNGADGLSAARILHFAGYDVSIVCVAENLNAFAKNRYNAAKYLGMDVAGYNGTLPVCDVLIDALFGTGLNKPLNGKYAEVIGQINRLTCYKISVDIPSGLNADTGEAMGTAVIADETVTFSAVKRGHFLCGAAAYTGKLTVADIGILSINPQMFCLETADAAALPRKRVSHKYNYGFVKLIAGSQNMPGAAELARRAAATALKSGAGLCCLCVPASLKDVFRQNPGETMYQFLPDSDGKIIYDERALDAVIQKADVILVGPGLGNTADLQKIIRYICQQFAGTLVLDADGLNALADNPDGIADKKCGLVLTPHAGEFDRLTQAFSFRSGDLIGRVREYAAAAEACVVYKSDLHIIACKGQVFINPLLTPGLAKGGSGDVLAGLIAAFAADKTAPLLSGADRIASAVCRASLAYAGAAIKAVQNTGEAGLLPFELIKFI